MAAELPAWPPSMTPEQEEALLQHSVDWALSHSLVLRPVPRAADTSSAPSSSPFNTSVMHAPFALLPTPFPRAAFKKAVSLQCAYNDLYANIASSPDFLHQILAPVAAVDPFQAQLYEIYKSTMRTDAAHKPQQQTTLGLFRSDYLLHQEDGLPKQVEFNTVSSSFGALSTRVSEMHREASKAGHALFPQHAALKLDNLPENQALDALADGLAAGHKAFNKTSSVILMVVQAGERNAFDQRLLEWSLLSLHGIRCLRRTFQELVALPLDPNTSDLLVLTPAGPALVSLIYYRAGYGPADYPSSTEWATRLKLEQSTAIKCPSVGLQLAGAKKVQQVLATDRSLLRRFMSPAYASQAEALQDTFMGIWPLDHHSPAGQEALKLAQTQSERFVMKPQREGGGNNIYREAIPKALSKMKSEAEVEGYILMELIQPPSVSNIMVRGGAGQGLRGEVISELGCYGVCLFNQHTGEIQENEYAGHLLRTKGATDDEGGVAVGFSVIDSPLLV